MGSTEADSAARRGETSASLTEDTLTMKERLLSNQSLTVTRMKCVNVCKDIIDAGETREHAASLLGPVGPSITARQQCCGLCKGSLRTGENNLQRRSILPQSVWRGSRRVAAGRLPASNSGGAQPRKAAIPSVRGAAKILWNARSWGVCGSRRIVAAAVCSSSSNAGAITSAYLLPHPGVIQVYNDIPVLSSFVKVTFFVGKQGLMSHQASAVADRHVSDAHLECSKGK